jgi:hypothetical protein
MWKNRKIRIYVLIIFTLCNISSFADEKKYLTNSTIVKYFYQPDIPSEIKINFIGKDYIKYLKQIKKVGEKKNLLTSLTNSNEKKWVNAELHWNEKDSIKIKLKLHGDFNDHISIPYSSLRVKSKNDFLNQTKEFILFKPRTRRFDAEVFGTLLLSKIGILAPFTKEISVKINSNKSEDYIFQEKINKYLIERAGLREGPIIEFDERHLWNYYLLQKDAKIDSASIYKIDNSKYAKNKITQHQVFKSIQTKQNIIQDVSFENRMFESTLSILGACHGLAKHNRKYYYDSFNQKFLPIYYDGMFFYKEKNLCEDVRTLDNKFFFSKDVAEHLQTYFNDINFKKELKKDYFFSTIDKDKERFDYLWNYTIKNFEKYRNTIKKENFDSSETAKYLNNKSLDQALNQLQSDYPIIYYYNNILDNKKISCVLWPNKSSNGVIKSNKGEFIYQSGKNCKPLKTKEVKNYLRDKIYYKTDKYKNIKIYPIFLGNVLKGKLTNKTHEPIIENIKINNDDDAKTIMLKQNTILVIDFDDNGKLFENLNFISNDPGNSAVVLRGSNINIKNIQYSEKKDVLKKKSSIGFYNLTGCVNFIDSNFSIENIKIKKSSCEDGVNIINSSGVINNVKISNTFSDGIDLDYSKVLMKNVSIKNSGGDCLDVSFGHYVLKKILVENCTDKGISIGEMSNMKIDDATLISNNIGIAAKDSSKLLINNILEEKNNSTCLALYKKKKEFSGGRIIYQKIPKSCVNSIILDKHSKLIKNN